MTTTTSSTNDPPPDGEQASAAGEQAEAVSRYAKMLDEKVSDEAYAAKIRAEWDAIHVKEFLANFGKLARSVRTSHERIEALSEQVTRALALVPRVDHLERIGPVAFPQGARKLRDLTPLEKARIETLRGSSRVTTYERRGAEA